MNKFFFLGTALVALIASCNMHKKTTKFRFSSPKAGTMVNVGDTVSLKLEFPEDLSTIDSVVYTMDDKVLAKRTDSVAVTLETNDAAFGSRTLSARLYHGGKEQVTYSNIVVVPQPPKQYGFTVVNEYPHDTEAFTQGLQYENGHFYESTGQYGKSSLRRVVYQTGEVVQRVDLDDKFFGEGMTVIGDRIVQLTYREKVGFIYDKNTFAKIGEFSYGQSPEGWGLCYDGSRLIKSDGSSRLYFLNRDTYAEEGFIEVFDNRGPVDSINELEGNNVKIYANIYEDDVIVIINPTTGAVESKINLIGIYPNKQEFDNELNGIAYDSQGDRLFVTGKNWSKLYEIALT